MMEVEILIGHKKTDGLRTRGDNAMIIGLQAPYDVDPFSCVRAHGSFMGFSNAYESLAYMGNRFEVAV